MFDGVSVEWSEVRVGFDGVGWVRGEGGGGVR